MALCPQVIIAITLGNKFLAGGVGASVSAPFMLAFVDGLRTRNMTFENLRQNDTLVSGREYEAFMNTFGLTAVSRLRTADLYLLNSSFDRVAKLASQNEFSVLSNVHFKGVMPQDGMGRIRFKVPHVPAGRYFLKYVSGWTIWRHEGKFSALSSSFVINNNTACQGNACNLNFPLIRDPNSFTRETAPQELQFLYNHYEGMLKGMQDFLNGVIDFPEGAARSLIAGDFGQFMADPVQSIRNKANDWENGFERNPFQASGQAVGAGIAGLLAVKGVQKLAEMKPFGVAKCPGGVCTTGNILFDIEGTSCKDCTSTIKNALEKMGILGDFAPIKDMKTQFLVKKSAGYTPNEIQKFINEIGFDSKIVQLSAT